MRATAVKPQADEVAGLPLAPPRPWAVAGLLLLIALFCGTVGVLAAARIRLYVATWDMAIFNQIMWLLAHFKELYLTTRLLYVFEHHLHFLMLLLLPLYRLAPEPLTLVHLQTAAVALGAVPVYLLARRLYRGELTALAWAALYLHYPAVQNMTLHDVHSPVIATPLFLAALYCAECRAWRWYALWMGLALLAQEDAGLAVGALGVGLWLAGERRVGALSAVVGFGYTVLGAKVLLPAFGPDLNEVYVTDFTFGSLGGTMLQVALAPILRPEALWHNLTRPENGWLLVHLLVPVALLAVLKPSWLCGALVVLYLNMVCDFWPAQTITYHYTAYLNPFIIMASVAGGAWLARQLEARGGRRATARGLAPAAALLGTLLLPLAWPERFAAPAVTAFTVRPILDIWSAKRAWAPACDAAMARIGPDESVAASMFLLPAVSGRERVWRFPWPFYDVERAAADTAAVVHGLRQGLAREPVDWLILQVRPGVPMPLNAESHAAALAVVETSPHYRLAADLGEVRFYRRVR